MSDRRRTKSRKIQRSIDEEIARRLGPPSRKYPEAPPRDPGLIRGYTPADVKLMTASAPTIEEFVEARRRARNHRLVVGVTVAISIAGVIFCAFMLFR
jgi:hypothetical protein